MKIKKIKFFLLLIFIGCDYTSSYDLKCNSHLYDLIEKSSIETWNREGVKLISQGGSFIYGIAKLDLTYSQIIDSKFDINKSRIIIFNVINSLLDTINENKKIRKYLINFPFTVNNLDIGIIFYDKQENEIWHSVILSNNKLVYLKNVGKFEKLEKIYEESIDEALEKLNQT
ncbi:MAG: hypothetical protein Tsb0015_08460 [Simkaniaceae bacterium]